MRAAVPDTAQMNHFVVLPIACDAAAAAAAAAAATTGMAMDARAAAKRVVTDDLLEFGWSTTALLKHLGRAAAKVPVVLQPARAGAPAWQLAAYGGPMTTALRRGFPVVLHVACHANFAGTHLLAGGRRLEPAQVAAAIAEALPPSVRGAPGTLAVVLHVCNAAGHDLEWVPDRIVRHSFAGRLATALADALPAMTPVVAGFAGVYRSMSMATGVRVARSRGCSDAAPWRDTSWQRACVVVDGAAAEASRFDAAHPVHRHMALSK